MVLSNDWFWNYVDMIMQTSQLPHIMDLSYNGNKILLVILLCLDELKDTSCDVHILAFFTCDMY